MDFTFFSVVCGSGKFRSRAVAPVQKLRAIYFGNSIWHSLRHAFRSTVPHCIQIIYSGPTATTSCRRLAQDKEEEHKTEGKKKEFALTPFTKP